jgi:ferrous iron transport protein B
VLTNRIFRHIGITGKSIMPLVLGFGCKTMATLTTRGLQSRKEKYIAIFLIAFAIPCSAQLGLNMAILGRIGFKAFVIASAALFFLELCAGVVLNSILRDDGTSDFIQELPQIRIPNVKAIVVKTYYRLKWFVMEAVPIFVIAAVTLFFFDRVGGLAALKKILQPIVVGWLGLPIDIVEALILTMARHEAASAFLLKMADAGQLSSEQCIVAVVTTTMFVPCFANIVAMCRELSVKTGLLMALLINVLSFILGGVVMRIVGLFY